MGRVCVSWCRCCVFVSVVHPVVILSAVVCVICSLLMFVSDANCDHMVEMYSSMGLVMALYVAMIVSFCFPHVVDVSVLSICIVLLAFVVVFSMCLLYVTLGLRVSPNIFRLMVMGSVVLSICSESCVLYSAVSGVKRVHVVLSGLRMWLFVCVHVCISCRYDWMFAFAIFMSLCVYIMVMSSAYVVSFTGACGVGVSDVYMLISMGDRTPTCGTPVLNSRCVNVLFYRIIGILIV